MDDVIQIAYQIEDNMKLHSSMKPFVENVPRCVAYNDGGSSSKQITQSVISSSRPNRQFSPSKSIGSEGSVSKSKGDQCYNCKGYGHHKSQCPSKFMGLTEKQPLEKDELEEVYELTDDMVLECKRELAEEAKERVARGFSGLMHLMFMM